MVLGLHTFDFAGVKDDPCTTSSSSKLVQVMISACDSGQFTCNDGQCVSIDERCNQISNCRDESDEENCLMLVKKDTYNSKIAPFAYDYVKSEVLPVDVNVSIAVMDVLSISETDLVYVLKFRFMMTWFDYRLKYHNLKKDRSLNSLSRDEVGALWIPYVVFANTENSEAVRGDDESEVTISREGNYKESPVTVKQEINVFDGNQNRIMFQQLYSKTFKCVYQLQLYPFDTQKCTVDMELRELDKPTINMIPEDIFMEGDTVLVQYIIAKWSLELKDPGDSNQGINLKLVMKRRIMNELLTSYLPSVLILAIVYATNFFKPFFFEAIVATNLTSQLVLTTLFISVSKSLPPTSYVKMIDVWLIFSQLIPFVEVLLHTYLDALRSDDDREINHHGEVITPGGDNHTAESSINGMEELFKKSSKIIDVEGEDKHNKQGKLKDDKNAKPTLADMTSRNEKDLVKARRNFYEEAKVNEKHLKQGEWIAKKGIPIVIVIFAILYWSYGLFFYFAPLD